MQEWKLEHDARLCGDGRVSLARAAKEAGVSLWEMMDYASTRKLAAQYDRADFARDLKVLSAGRAR